MRRILAPLFASVLVLAGCGGGGSDSTDSASGPTVDTKFGAIEVPADPQKVVAVGWGDAETALALGVQPVGASDWVEFGGKGVGPWAEDLYDQDPEIIATMEPDYEQIAALEPDLILDTNSSGEQKRYDRLSEIAPTVGVPEGGDNYLTTLDQQVELVSEALGKPDDGQKLLDDLDQTFKDAAKAHPEFKGKTATVAAKTADGWGAYVEASSRVQVMERLGFKQSPNVDESKAEGFSVPVSEENLKTLDADVLLTFPIYIPDTDVTKDEGYKRIPAVKDGRSLVFTDKMDDLRMAFSLNSILSAKYAAEHLPDELEKIVK
ncbi:ABC transporter substrate-binding protein [Brevibacterium oceani]|uniref:ABC transporter substrate-binding protein n=1 Tax=Brevibacterium oceani TaxID=358099 RepID=UPI0015E7D9B9|nr:iron-siderophore ABC transporter substrate-binding protein [Brevibacterium oceani]